MEASPKKTLQETECETSPKAKRQKMQTPDPVTEGRPVAETSSPESVNTSLTSNETLCCGPEGEYDDLDLDWINKEEYMLEEFKLEQSKLEEQYKELKIWCEEIMANSTKESEVLPIVVMEPSKNCCVVCLKPFGDEVPKKQIKAPKNEKIFRKIFDIPPLDLFHIDFNEELNVCPQCFEYVDGAEKGPVSEDPESPFIVNKNKLVSTFFDSVLEDNNLPKSEERSYSNFRLIAFNRWMHVEPYRTRHEEWMRLEHTKTLLEAECQTSPKAKRRKMRTPDADKAGKKERLNTFLASIKRLCRKPMLEFELDLNWVDKQEEFESMALSLSELTFNTMEETSLIRNWSRNEIDESGQNSPTQPKQPRFNN